MNEILHKKVSPLFEGGWALRICPLGKFSEEPGEREGVGTIDYLIYTVFYFPTGVVDSLIRFSFIGMKNKNLFNMKSLKSFRSSLKDKSISAKAEL